MAVPVIGIAAVPSLPLTTANGDLVFVMLFLPTVMWLVAMSNPPQALKVPMEWLGNFSLPLYCVHLTVLVWVSEALGRDAWVRVMAVAAAMAVAWVFSKLVSFQSKPTVVKTSPAG